ncbi:MAG: D-lyxose/D-mannose family sugar isomerase [Candidatus Melainabacteria bacterium]|nr:D-lyxose/D-mannose family sugar isomerase [Candidatus Melainabacteria bacterium]
MKRSQIDATIARSIINAERLGIALPKWASWSPSQFAADADGVRRQGLGWKVVDFGLGDFDNCGLVLLVVCNALLDETGEPIVRSQQIGNRTYPASSFSRKFLFVQPGQTEPHHFHRQKERKDVTILAGGPVRFELAWAESNTKLSSRPVDVQVDGIWHSLPAYGSIILNAGETVTLPGELSHIIEVPSKSRDAILLETSTANNDSSDNIFPFITPSSTPVEEDAEPKYQVLGEYIVAASQ